MRMLLTRACAILLTVAAVAALQMKMKPVMRRLLTRALAVIPAVIVAAVMGDKAVGQLLVISQVGRHAFMHALQHCAVVSGMVPDDVLLRRGAVHRY